MREAERGGGVDLPAQDRARRDGDQLVRALGRDVAQHERGAVEPRRHAQRAEVGHEVDVAVALLPAGELVAGDGLHLHVGGQQVVAPVRAGGGDLVEEQPGVVALADEPAVVIGETDDDRVDVASGDEVDQGLQGGHEPRLLLSRPNIAFCVL